MSFLKRIIIYHRRHPSNQNYTQVSNLKKAAADFEERKLQEVEMIHKDFE
jgi:hypothetical protein